MSKSGNLKKLSIEGYIDADFKKKSATKSFVTQINPESILLSKNVNLKSEKVPGNDSQALKYNQHEPGKLSFKITLDNSGVLENSNAINESVSLLEKNIYNLNSESHEPSYVKITWGSFIFKGRATSLKYNYKLFSSDGEPIRVEIDMDFEESENVVKSSKNSPDVSRTIMIKVGDTIPLICAEIYGDASFCYEVAAFNQLSNFRMVKVGSTVYFPPLK